MPRNIAAIPIAAVLLGFPISGPESFDLMTNAARAESAPLPDDLKNTSWQWVGFKSPVEEFAVKDSERYTIAFDGSDRISVRADCNRGTARAVSPAPGTLKVGPMALTRAMCPPGSLSDRFARDVSQATVNMLKDGELFLDLPADAGTLHFRKGP